MSPGTPPTRRELKFYGVNACLALRKVRPDDIIRIYVTKKLLPRFGDILKWAARERKAYHVVTSEVLERLTESVHHEGVCFLAREAQQLSLTNLLGSIGRHCSLLYLDGVANPHNLGFIMRTAAHFGVPAILGAEDLPRLSPSAARVAEGAAEFVGLVRLIRPAAELRMLRAEHSFRVAAAICGTARSLYQYKFSARSIIMLGNEVEGLDSRVRKWADDELVIPGTSVMDSLNVSVACGLILGEYWRQQCEPT